MPRPSTCHEMPLHPVLYPANKMLFFGWWNLTLHQENRTNEVHWIRLNQSITSGCSMFSTKHPIVLLVPSQHSAKSSPNILAQHLPIFHEILATCPGFYPSKRFCSPPPVAFLKRWRLAETKPFIFNPTCRQRNLQRSAETPQLPGLVNELT